MSIFDIILNIFEVLPKDIANMNQDTLIQAPLITGFFYFISRWFKAYVLRLGLFLFGIFILLQVFQGQSFLFRFDFYAGLGILLPHIEVVEISYLILRERTLFSYGKLQELISFIASPFVWLFHVAQDFLGFFKAKQKEKNYSREKSDYEAKSRQYKQQRQNQYQEQKKQKPYKQEKQNTQEWGESSDNYKVLRVSKTASKAEIKKAYRKLALLYHPDHTLNKKEEHQIIFVKIKDAYEALK